MQKLILNRQKYVDWMFGGKSDMIQLADTVIKKLKEHSSDSLEDILNESIYDTDYLPFHVIENIDEIDKDKYQNKEINDLNNYDIEIKWKSLMQ